MKPRIFIGSSVEGLNIAYAVQQNLQHDAEITVWSQGIFELSATTTESLSNILASTDFGIFIFSPDDALKMRGNESPSVRDNVLFEMGLFIGKLGRERVFFLIPSVSELHIPSDLLGVTPAKYDSVRTDNRMEAATGPACHQVRTQIKKLGPLPEQISTPSAPEGPSKSESEKRPWIQDFFDEKYSAARATLEEELKEHSGDDAIEIQGWIYYCDFKENEQLGLAKLYELASLNPSSAKAQTIVAFVLRFEHYIGRAIKLLNEVDPSLQEHPEIKIALSECHVMNEDPDTAISVLCGSSVIRNPEVAVALANILEGQEKLQKALDVIHQCYVENPRDQTLRYKYARIAQELQIFPVALYLLDDLKRENPKSLEYWGYIGNCCLALQLTDLALAAYRKAESLRQSDDSEEWIMSNIGNLFLNKGLPTEAYIYLEKAVKMALDSDYAHVRLAKSINQKNQNLKVYQQKCSEGFKMIKEFEVKSIED